MDWDLQKKLRSYLNDVDFAKTTNANMEPNTSGA